LFLNPGDRRLAAPRPPIEGAPMDVVILILNIVKDILNYLL